MTKRDRKRIAQLEAALRFIAKQTAGHDRVSKIGGLHEVASEILIGKRSMLSVTVRDTDAVAGMDYNTIYSGCPTEFFSREHAEDWFVKLDCANTWPKGNPRYRIIEIDGNIPVDVLTGRPT